MPLPLAVIAMVLILAGFALYVMLAFRFVQTAADGIAAARLQKSRCADRRGCGGFHAAIRPVRPPWSQVFTFD